MKRSPLKATRGVALVITLIMLSVVTIVAVAFLAVARRERASVGVADDLTDTRYLTEAALARAQADIASRMASTASRGDFVPFTSTNYSATRGFDPSMGSAAPYQAYGANPTNVAYTNVLGQALRFDNDDPKLREQYRALMGNLLYDARPPVFITTNAVSRQQDFRFYLDLNRNGQFDPPLNEPKSVGFFAGREIFTTNQIPGDPQWQGVLEHPNLPHSATNRFIGRIAYLVLPTGLDINYMHNRGKDLGANDSYLRNQGLGSWELNLAALLEGVDGGVWSNYNYRVDLGASSTGNSFFDANAVVQYRIAGTAQPSADAFFNPGTFHADSKALDLPFKKTFLDLYANGPIVRSLALPPPQNNSDVLTRSWDGSDRTRYFQNLEDLFSVSAGFSNRLRGAVRRANSNGTNDWTLYRLLSEVGTDSSDGRFYTAYDATKGYYRRAKMNLNFAHGEDGDIQKPSHGAVTPNKVGTFRPWDPIEFFTNAVDRLLESGLHYQGVTFHSDRIPVNYYGVSVVTNPPGSNRRVSYITNEIHYGPDIHHLLQMAANMNEAAMVRSNLPVAVRNLPTVFRPRFGYVPERFYLDNSTFVQTTNLYIMGWALVTNTSPIAYRWIDPIPENALQLRTLITNPAVATRFEYDPATDVNIHGVPWVIGARKGYPSFNEAFWQAEIGITRRVKLAKFPDTAQYATNGRVVSGSFSTNVQYLVDVTRRGSIEAWNSYQAEYKRPYRLVVTNLFCMGFSNYVNGQFRSLVPDTFVNSQSLLRFTNSTLVVSNSWPGSKTLGGSGDSFQVPIDFATLGRSLTNQLVFVPPGAVGAATAPSGQLMDLANPDTRRFGFDTRYYNAALSNSTPNLSVSMTNYLVYAMIDEGTGRVIDFVNLKSIALQTNILTWMGVMNTNNTYIGNPARVGNELVRDSHLWMTNIVDRNAPGITAGITNQVLASSLRPENVSVDVYRSADQRVDDKRKTVANFRYFVYRDAVDAEFRAYGTPNIKTNLTMDAIAPTRKFILTDRRSINDPLVHYTLQDLRPGVLWLVNKGAGSVPGLHTNKLGIALRQDMILRDPRSYAPWGVAPIFAGASELTSYNEDPRFKDPGITRSDDWNFPNEEMPTVGWLGRVHRGTPWQTMYLKSGVAPLGDQIAVMPSGDATWSTWSGFKANESVNYGIYRGRPGPLATNLNATTEPHGDWNLLHLFTTAYNDNAARGLLPADHYGEGGWAAVLGGVNVVRPNGTDTFIDPTSSDFKSIVTNIQLARLFLPQGRFTNLGGVLSASKLTVDSPYAAGWTNRVTTNTDALVERIPQQVLSLLRQPEPHFVIYAFGQSLKPAPGSLVTAPGPYFGICQNYQITGEQIVKTVVRYDGPATNLQAIVERQQVLSAP